MGSKSGLIWRLNDSNREEVTQPWNALVELSEATLAGMSRELLRTPDEFMVVEFERVMRLFGQALPNEKSRPLFERLTIEASAKGLNWIEALEYAAAKRVSNS